MISKHTISPRRQPPRKAKSSEKWTPAEDELLLKLVRAQCDEADTLSCNKAINKLDWKLIKIRNKSEEACKAQLTLLLKRIPRTRNLKEVINLRMLNDPVSEKKTRPQPKSRSKQTKKKSPVVPLGGTARTRSTASKRLFEIDAKDKGKGKKPKKEKMLENVEGTSFHNNPIPASEDPLNTKLKHQSKAQGKKIKREKVDETSGDETPSQADNNPNIHLPSTSKAAVSVKTNVRIKNENLEEPTENDQCSKEDLKRKNEIEGISTKKLKEDKDQREDNQEETSDTVNVEATQNLVSQSFRIQTSHSRLPFDVTRLAI